MNLLKQSAEIPSDHTRRGNTDKSHRTDAEADRRMDDGSARRQRMERGTA